MRKSSMSILLAVAALGGGGLARAEEQLVTTKQELPVTGAPWTLVQTSGGDVEVRGGPEGRVYVEARRRAPTKDEAEKLTVDVTYKNGVVRIVHPKDDKPNRSVSFVVQVPAPSRVQVVTAAGRIEVVGTTGGVQAATQAGALTVKDAKGELNVKSGAGAVTLERIEGPVTATTQAGAVHVTGKLRGVSTISSGAGAIDVAVPNDARLHIEAAAQTGTVRNGFGIPGDGAKFAGTLGDGKDGSLIVRTQAGAVNVHKL
jgi:DUF4097 and DUF4098 domain-containing protein YvlB